MSIKLKAMRTKTFITQGVLTNIGVVYRVIWESESIWFGTILKTDDKWGYCHHLEEVELYADDLKEIIELMDMIKAEEQKQLYGKVGQSYESNSSTGILYKESRGTLPDTQE
jgi:hypothetical protein